MKILKEFLNKSPNVYYLYNNYRYTSMLEFVPTKFFIFNDPLIKLPKVLPTNHRAVEAITADIVPDIILCFDKIKLYNKSRELANKYGCPLILIETENPNMASHKALINSHYDGVVVFSNEHANLWGYKEYDVIKYTNVKSLSNTKLYVQTDIAFDLVLETVAEMGSGKCVVAPSIYENTKLIKNGYNGYLYDPKIPNSYLSIVRKLKENTDLMDMVGLNAEETISKEYNNKIFADNWLSLIKKYGD